MEQKKKEQDVLLVRDEKTGEISVVAGLKKDGTPKRVPAKAENSQSFMKFDKHGDVLDNFFTNFFRQCKEPKRFGFYRVAAEMIDKLLGAMKELLKNPDTYKELLAPHKVDTEKYEQKIAQEQTPSETAPAEKQTDEHGINWKEVEERWGISRKELEDSGNLNKMLDHGKSDLIRIQPKFGDERFDIEARLSLRPMPDGNMSFVPHFIRKEPKLDVEYKGITFTPEDKEALKTSGNLGRVVELTNKTTGEVTSSFISIDRKTNEVIDIPVNKVRIPERIGNTIITPEEQAILRTGAAIKGKQIELINGKKFTTTLQANVEQKSVEFVPRNLQSRQDRFQQQGNLPKKETAENQDNKRSTWLDKDGNIRPVKTYFQISLTPQQQTDYVAGKTIEIQNVPDKKNGGTYTAYVKFNHEKQQPQTYRSNPDLSQAKEVIPTNENRTQVAVNSEGKTNEATRHVDGPLKSGQVAPVNEKQQELQKEGEKPNEPKRARGPKVG
ncbi:DUF3945 domain-containing protein [Bacteroides graminisolvens]|uniref:DUF3945 domain-containing protein n=1 Tax=Bacteroides graminisolvens TaxID=477666 RepID=UPI002409B3ED|nr:DUF3945 domain-containing protein [Bacteroides graminisolvens]